MTPVRLQDTWSDARSAVVAQRIQRRLGQRRRLPAVLAVAVTIGAVVAGAVALRSGISSSDSATFYFGDGSVATRVGHLVTLADRLDEVRVRLAEGSARFDVVRRPSRRFIVEAPPVLIEVVGTKFSVVRDQHNVRVWVEEGQVQVLTAGERTELATGQWAEFALALPPAAAEGPQLPEPAPAAPRPSPDWRSLANRGEFDRAWPLLKAVRDEPKELFLASDVARLSGHSEQARVYLVQLVARHPRDRRAPLAAFTLGRVLLEELGWPRDAAEAFAKARELAPSGPLAEDALAREVEAWSRAGEAERARSAAERYLEKYPQGQRALGVRRHGGL